MNMLICRRLVKTSKFYLSGLTIQVVGFTVYSRGGTPTSFVHESTPSKHLYGHVCI